MAGILPRPSRSGGVGSLRKLTVLAPPRARQEAPCARSATIRAMSTTALGLPNRFPFAFALAEVPRADTFAN